MAKHKYALSYVNGRHIILVRMTDGVWQEYKEMPEYGAALNELRQLQHPGKRPLLLVTKVWDWKTTLMLWIFALVIGGGVGWILSLPSYELMFKFMILVACAFSASFLVIAMQSRITERVKLLYKNLNEHNRKIKEKERDDYYLRLAETRKTLGGDSQ